MRGRAHLDRIAELVGDVAHLVQGVAHVPVALQKVKHRLAQDLEGEAHVAKIVEGVKHPHTEVLPRRVLGVQLAQHVHLQLGRLPILVDVLDDLHGDTVLCLVVLHLHHLAEGPFAQRGEDLVPVANPVAGQVGQMTVAGVRQWPPADRAGTRRPVQGEGRAVGGAAVGGGAGASV